MIILVTMSWDIFKYDFFHQYNWLYFIFQAVSFILIVNETRLQSLVLKGIFPHFHQVSHGIGRSGYSIISEHLENVYYFVPRYLQEIL